ncbi:MAG: DNA polymerase III subunit delta [Erysipelotrichales bacterium]|nr:DNA polymerase III subunit delta [Erysipelotrichales bacterium]
MIYIIYGVQEPIVMKQVKNLISSTLQKIDDFNLINFDFEQSSIKQIIDDVSTYPFCDTQKVVLVKNSLFLSDIKNLKPCLDNDIDLNDISLLVNYASNQNSFTTLVLTFLGKKLDIKNADIKKKVNSSKVIEVNDISKEDWPIVVKRLFSNRKIEITEHALASFISRVGTDLVDVINEVDKISLYSNKVDENIVNNLVAIPLEKSEFGIANALINHDNSTALLIYRDLKTQNVEPIYLISVMGSQIRFLYQVSYLYSLGKNEVEIADELEVKTSRVAVNLRKMGNVTLEEMLKTLNDLSQLDFKIKSGKIDRFQGLELFLIGAFR